MRLKYKRIIVLPEIYKKVGSILDRGIEND